MKFIKKSPWVCYFNSGGCISGDTEIILDDGSILTAKEIIDNHLGGNKIKEISKGAVWSRMCEFGILSKEGPSPQVKKAIRVYKLKSPSKLLSIETSTASLKLTPEHKVLVDRIGGPEWTEAKELEEGDYLFCPRKIYIQKYLRKFDKTLFHKEPDEDLLYVLGLIASDGFISVSRGRRHATYKIAFDNNEKGLVDLFIAKIKKWVPHAKPSIYIESKQPKLKRVNVYSKKFVRMANFLGIGKKTDLSTIFKLPENLIAAFLGGLFDGDGHITFDPKRKKQRVTIAYSTADGKVAKQIQLLLKRIGIAGRIDSTVNKSTFGTKIMHRVRITFQDDILRFAESVPVMHPKKQEKIKFARNYLEKFNDKYAKINMAPLAVGRLIRDIRKKSGLTQDELHAHPAFISMIECGRRVQKHIVKQIFDSLKDHTSEKGKEHLRKILSDGFYLDPIKKITQIKAKDDFVYNFEVQDTHNYVPANGFVISNCNGCALETVALVTPRYDIERFGCVLKSSARHADILLVTGALTEQGKKRLVRVYRQMSPDKKVIAIGVCAISGGPFRGGYNIRQRVDQVIPVDMYVPGCPPRPEAIIDALIKVLRSLK